MSFKTYDEQKLNGTSPILGEEYKTGTHGDDRDIGRINQLKETIASCWVQGADLDNEHFGTLREKVCLFKLSDLGLWRAFPLVYLKRGLLIWLNLNTTSSFCYLQTDVNAVNATATQYKLSEP